MIKLTAVVLTVCIPFIAVTAVGAAIDPQFGNTFLGALADKYHRVNTVTEPKIICVGGSSLAFGLRSDLLEQELNMPVVNFGLYATLGTKFMLDLSRAGIKSGDIIIVAPELDAQTLSLYFNAESTWQAFDSDMQMLLHTDFKDYGTLAGNYWNYVISKLKYKRYGGLNPEGVYNKGAFNEYGDIIYPRPYNIMLLGYDRNHPIDLSPSILSEDFTEYLNKYIKFAKGKGASVYFNFPPMNRQGVMQYGDDNAIYEFYNCLVQAFDCEIIGNVNNYILDEKYFYDSNFHLNDSGVMIRTALLAEDIKRALDIDSPVLIELPKPPEKPMHENSAGDEAYSEYYIYEPYAGGLIITGTSEEAKEMSVLAVPRFSEGLPVLAIGEKAFAGCAVLDTLVIYDNIAQFNDRVFEGCIRLEAIVFNADEANSVAVGDDLFGGAPESCKIYLPRDGFGNFAADYFWSRYAGRMDVIK